MTPLITQRPAPRAFALPLVLAIVILGTFIMMAVLERYSGQRLIIEKQLDAYQDHHISRGVREAVDAWAGAASAGAPQRPATGEQPAVKTIQDYLGPEGHAFDLAPKDGAPVSVYMHEAQGTLLADFSGLSGQELQAAAGALAALEEVAPSTINPTKYTRKEGPLAVSVRSATPTVLSAICRSALGPTKGREFAEELIRVRQQPDFDATKLNEAYQRTGVNGEDAAKLQMLLTASPGLWLVVAEMDGSNNSIVRYRGLTTVRGSMAARNRQNGNRPGQFLSWERVFDTTQPRFERLE